MSSAGYALFKAKDSKLLKSKSLGDDMASASDAVGALKLRKFSVCPIPGYLYPIDFC